jgi:hypothetical protein
MLATRLTCRLAGWAVGDGDGADLGTRHSGERGQLARRVVLPSPGLPGTWSTIFDYSLVLTAHYRPPAQANSTVNASSAHWTGLYVDGDNDGMPPSSPSSLPSKQGLPHMLMSGPLPGERRCQPWRWSLGQAHYKNGADDGKERAVWMSHGCALPTVSQYAPGIVSGRCCVIRVVVVHAFLMSALYAPI